VKRYLLAGAVLAGLLLGSGVQADTVFLADGSRVHGQVKVAGGRVAIRTADATLTLPSRRVSRIVPGYVPARDAGPQAQQPAEEQKEQASERAPSTLAPASPAPRQAAGPPSLIGALSEVIDVDFDGVPPDEVFEYVRQVTNMNLVLDNEVRRDVQAVHMRLRDVSVARVLDLLRELNGSSYTVRPGEILFVRMSRPGAGYVVRIYPAMDVLVSTEDTGQGNRGGYGSGGQDFSGSSSGPGGRGSGSGSRGGRGRGDVSPQFGGNSVGGAALRGVGGTETELSARAKDLIELMRQTCGQGNWQPAPATAP